MPASARARKLVGRMEMNAGIDQLSAQEIERRFVVEHDVVKRIGDDLRDPHQSGLDVLDDAQLNRPEQKPAKADHEPDLRHVTHEFVSVGMWREDSKISWIEEQRDRRQRPDRK